MEIKLIEVRDTATFIPAIAIVFIGGEHPLLREAGYGYDTPYVLFAKLNKGQITYSPYDWSGSRTMHVAHSYLIEHWNEIKSGDVVDVEFILGETQEKKISQRLEDGGL